MSAERPEDQCADPSEFYTDDEVKKYERSGSYIRAQQKIANRIVELLDLPAGSKLLDLGVGTGFTMLIYDHNDYDVIGVDKLDNMLSYAKAKGFEVHKQDIRELDSYGEFDAVVSASCIQWIRKKEEMLKVVEGIKKNLKLNGKVVIQFYPKDDNELTLWKEAFSINGFSGGELIENKNNARKRLIFLIYSLSKR